MIPITTVRGPILAFLLYSWKIETLFPKLEDQKLQTMQLLELKVIFLCFTEVWNVEKITSIWHENRGLDVI